MPARHTDIYHANASEIAENVRRLRAELEKTKDSSARIKFAIWIGVWLSGMKPTGKNVERLLACAALEVEAALKQAKQQTVVSSRHFFFMVPHRDHVSGMMRTALNELRGFAGGRR